MYAKLSDYVDLIGEDDILETSEIEDNLRLASVKIDEMTFGRIGSAGFDKLTEFQKGCVVRATCYQARYIAENGYDEAEVSSYTIGKLSVSTGQSSSPASRYHMSPAAYAALRSSGLMWRGA